MARLSAWNVTWAGGHAGLLSEFEIRSWGALVESHPSTHGRVKRPSQI